MHTFTICLRLTPNTKRPLPKSIFDRLRHNPALNTREVKGHSAALGKVPKDHRFGPIRVDWVDMEPTEKGKDKVSDPGKGKYFSLSCL
jgi:hypothetical protein